MITLCGIIRFFETNRTFCHFGYFSCYVVRTTILQVNKTSSIFLSNYIEIYFNFSFNQLINNVDIYPM